MDAKAEAILNHIKNHKNETHLLQGFLYMYEWARLSGELPFLITKLQQVNDELEAMAVGGLS